MVSLCNLTKQLISIPSAHPSLDQLVHIVSFVGEYFSDTQFYIREYVDGGFPSIVISNKDTKDFDIIFSGHLDVVPADNNQFKPHEDENYIFGRGAYDMKSGVAVMMHILKNFKRTDISIALMLTTDEEIGGFHGTKYLLETQGYNARVALIPDGGYKESQIALEEKGILQLKISTVGMSAHGSRPWQGDNAIEKLMKAISIVQEELEKEKTDDKEYRYTTGILSTITGGTVNNSVPESASATFDIRYTETFLVENFISTIKNNIASCNSTVDVLMCEPCVSVSQDNYYVSQYVQAAQSCGVRLCFSHDYGASDARFFSAKGIPVILSQPSGDGMHSEFERVRIESIKMYKHIVQNFIDNFVV